MIPFFFGGDVTVDRHSSWIPTINTLREKNKLFQSYEFVLGFRKFVTYSNGPFIKIVKYPFSHVYVRLHTFHQHTSNFWERVRIHLLTTHERNNRSTTFFCSRDYNINRRLCTLDMYMYLFIFLPRCCVEIRKIRLVNIYQNHNLWSYAKEGHTNRGTLNCTDFSWGNISPRSKS